MKNNNFEELKNEIKRINEIHLEETAYLVKELGGFGEGSGFEFDGSILPMPIRAKTEKEYKELALFNSIYELWSDAGKCYINRIFRGCTISLVCLIEALICLELLKKEGAFPENFTLGQLIGYCESKQVFSEKILNELKEINKLRKFAIHLIYEKEKPENLKIFDEKVPIKKFKNPLTQIKNGCIIGDDVLVEVDFTTKETYVNYPYKKLAEITYVHVQSILKDLYGSKFKFSFKESSKNIKI